MRVGVGVGVLLLCEFEYDVFATSHLLSSIAADDYIIMEQYMPKHDPKGVPLRRIVCYWYNQKVDIVIHEGTFRRY